MVSWSGLCGNTNVPWLQLVPSLSLREMLLFAIRRPATWVRLVWWSIVRIASSLTCPCWAGVTSVKVGAGGDVVSSHLIRVIWLPDMYIVFPESQLASMFGSPAL